MKMASPSSFKTAKSMNRSIRLDVLIYAHDGRGLGHASRSIGIGLALRRLYPELKVLFVSGCRLSSELIGAGPLDWIKLPAYETEVLNGTSRGVIGKSMFSDRELGKIRDKALENLVSLYRPRIVLVDHTPQGKHRELVSALSRTVNSDTLWVLGVRGILGAVSQAKSELAGSLFINHYYSLLWYGDSAVLGTSHLSQLRGQYKVDPVECGYVLRLAEYVLSNNLKDEGATVLAGTISIPWLGEKTLEFLSELAVALARVPKSYGSWHLYIDPGPLTGTQKSVDRLFSEVDCCLVEPPGRNYVRSLLRSKTALVYGGYNSVMDVVHSGVPALVVLREMKDKEQEVHLERIINATGGQFSTVSESVATAEELEECLLANLHKAGNSFPGFMVEGAGRAAEYLYQLLD